MKSLLLILLVACTAPIALAAASAPRAAPSASTAAAPAPRATAPAPRATAPAPRASAPAPRAAANPAPATARLLSPAEQAAASPVPMWLRHGILVEQGGRALYTFTDDTLGQSRCDQRCEALWPPHYAEDGAKPFGPFTLARSSSGRVMWAWEGKPLYRWISDRKRGAAGGDGVAGVWFLVKVPADKRGWVSNYFPMPMPRAGQPAANSTSANPSRTRP